MVLTKREKALIEHIKQKMTVHVSKGNCWGGGTAVTVELKFDGETFSKDDYLV